MSASYHYEVRLAEDRYVIAENGLDLGYERCPEFVMRVLFRRINGRAMEALADSAIIHGGCGRHEGRRFLVVGAKFSGKSTTMTRLLFEGVEAQGDEMAILSNGAVTAFPRRFHLREPSLAYLPELDPGKLPCLIGEHDRRLFAFDPAEAGFDWRIDTGRVEAIFFLEQNHGGQTRLVPCPKVEMVQHVVSQSILPAHARGRWIAEVAAVVDQARTYVLYNGEPSESAAMIVGHL